MKADPDSQHRFYNLLTLSRTYITELRQDFSQEHGRELLGLISKQLREDAGK
jgi:hypothetical protein